MFVHNDLTFDKGLRKNNKEENHAYIIFYEIIFNIPQNTVTKFHRLLVWKTNNPENIIFEITANS